MGALHRFSEFRSGNWFGLGPTNGETSGRKGKRLDIRAGRDDIYGSALYFVERLHSALFVW